MNIYSFKLQLCNVYSIESYGQSILVSSIEEALNIIFIDCKICIQSLFMENNTNMTNMSMLNNPLYAYRASLILDVQLMGNYNNCINGFKALRNDGILRTRVGDLYVDSFSWFNNTYNYLPMSNTSNVQFDDIVYNDMSMLVDQEKVNDKQEQIIQSDIRKICVLD